MIQRKALRTAAVAAVCAALTASFAFAEGTSKVKVTVKKAGDPCKREVIQMAADPNCEKAREGKKAGTENCIVSKEGQVKDVIVYVKDGLKEENFPVPTEEKTIDQHGCMYQPHVQTIMIDQKLVIKNSDATLHNIHSFATKQKQFNFAQPNQGATETVTFKQVEFVHVKCDVHPWMSAYVGVFKHPFSAVTEKDGTATIEKLPAGEYTIGIWHEELGEQEQKVTIADGETKELSFEYKDK